MSHCARRLCVRRVYTSCHIPMSHVTYKRVMSHINESCHIVAGAFARAVSARRLVLTHFSPRYRGDSAEFARRIMLQIEQYARKAFSPPAPPVSSPTLPLPSLPTATHCHILQHTAAHCNTLQHTATHCNTLQHTAAHCHTLPPNACLRDSDGDFYCSMSHVKESCHM